MKKNTYICLITMLVVMTSLTGCVKKSNTDSSSIKSTNADEKVVTDETGVYPKTTGLTELPLGFGDTACTIKVPLNYILAGATISENGEDKTVKGLGATVTVDEAFKDGNITDNQALSGFGMTSLDASPTMIDTKIYDTTVAGTIEDMKNTFPKGHEIGDSTMPGWVYQNVETSLNPYADVAMGIQVSDSTLISVFYQGPVADTVSEEEMAQRVYNLVTKK